LYHNEIDTEDSFNCAEILDYWLTPSWSAYLVIAGYIVKIVMK